MYINSKFIIKLFELKDRIVKLLFVAFFDTISREKVFCISMQRSGTTSVGKFFRDHGYRWSGWPSDKKNMWSRSRLEGNYEKIFRSLDFRASNAFEDSPWWGPEFYKVLYHRFPNSKFILMERDEDAWYKSMCSLFGGDIIGTALNHCKIYRREDEYYDLLDRGMINEISENTHGTRKIMKLTDKGQHYKALYKLHNREVKDFFKRHDETRLFVCNLEDPAKWQKLGEFLRIDVESSYDSHENKTI